MSEKHLVRGPNWVGDAVMSLPFFASLRRNAGPDAVVACLCCPTLAPLFRDVPEINEVIELDESAGRSGWRFIRQNAQRLHQLQFDTAFCLPTSFGSALMLRLARIPHRLGHAAEGRRFLLTHSLPYGRNGRRPHRAEGFLRLLGLFWPDPILERSLHFNPDDTAKSRVDALFRETTGALNLPALAIAPGAAQPNKMWMAQHFAVIAARWVDQFHGNVFLVGSDSDRERCQEVANLAAQDAIRNLAGAGDLPVAAEIIRRAAVFLGNDSGLAHLAAAVGTPPVVISGPGDPTEVAPFSPLAVTVRHPVFCSPCYKNSCWRKDRPLECLTEIGIEDVWQHVTAKAEAPTDRP
jgi:heptosyltransferase-2